MHSIFFCISFRKTAASHSYRLTILPPSSLLLSPYFNPSSLLTPIASLFFLPPPSYFLHISTAPHTYLLTIYKSVRKADTAISHFSFLISNFILALVFCRRICYYKACLSPGCTSQRKPRSIAQYGASPQPYPVQSGARYRNPVDHELSKLQQDKRIYHTTSVKRFLADVVFQVIFLGREQKS